MKATNAMKPTVRNDDLIAARLRAAAMWQMLTFQKRMLRDREARDEKYAAQAQMDADLDDSAMEAIKAPRAMKAMKAMKWADAPTYDIIEDVWGNSRCVRVPKAMPMKAMKTIKAMKAKKAQARELSVTIPGLTLSMKF